MKNRIDEIFNEKYRESISLRNTIRTTARQFAAELIMSYEHPSIVDISAAYEIVDKFIRI